MCMLCIYIDFLYIIKYGCIKTEIMFILTDSIAINLKKLYFFF